MNQKNEESPKWYAVAAVVMLIAGFIWAYSASVNGNSNYSIWSVINFATAGYCWMQFLKLKKGKDQDHKGGKKK